MNKKRRKARNSKIRLCSAILLLLVSFGLLLYLFISERNDVAKTQSYVETETLTEDRETEIVETIQQNNKEEPITEEAKEAELEEENQRKISQLLTDMTVEEKVAQLFMITPEALTGYGTVTAASDVTRQALEKYPVGGIIFFAKNIVNPEQLTEMTGNLNRYSMGLSGVPMFLGIDEEGGKVSRIAGNENFDVQKISDMRVIGDTKDINQAYQAGSFIGNYLNQYGLNVDFAPVADVLTNEENVLLKNRSFGTDAKLVSDMNREYVRGLNENSVYGCLKHFPGHGGTAGDTHAGYAYTERTLEEMQKEELVPFQQGIDNGINFIMVSHISAEKLTGDSIPASLSYGITTELLREKMGYDGIVITDAMNMGAVADSYGSAAGAVKAILAGADIVLMPVDFLSAYQGVIEAVADGTISEERLNCSVERILKVKVEMQNP